MTRRRFAILFPRRYEGAVLKLPGSVVLGPSVYLIERNEKPLYIGMSSRGLARALHHKHHVLGEELRPTDEIYAWTFATTAEAKQFETQLIIELRPLRNIIGNLAERSERSRPDVPRKPFYFRSEIWRRLRGGRAR